MISPPLGLPEAALVSALRCGWGIAVASVAYRPVGWGSHHWEVADAAGGRWFVTVDELAGKRLREGEPLAAGFGRLRASLAAARDLRGCGRRFVVASVPAGYGEPVVRVGDGFAVAVYPFVDGQSFAWGEFSSSAHRLGVLEMVAAVHTAPAGTCGQVMPDDFAVPRRDEMEAACDRAGDVADCGPYASAVSHLVRQNAVPIRRLLDRYDRLVMQARAGPARMVLTHGEPHPGNTMLTADGSWLLIDWDTALVAPPERDLWSLDPGDGTVLDAYAWATGVSLRPWLRPPEPPLCGPLPRAAAAPWLSSRRPCDRRPPPTAQPPSVPLMPDSS